METQSPRSRTCAALSASYSTPSNLFAIFNCTTDDTSEALNFAFCAAQQAVRLPACGQHTRRGCSFVYNADWNPRALP